MGIRPWNRRAWAARVARAGASGSLHRAAEDASRNGLIVPCLGSRRGASFQAVLAFVISVVAAGILALSTSVVLFVLLRFERFVGVRYLERRRTTRPVRAGLWSAMALTVASLVLFVVA